MRLLIIIAIALLTVYILTYVSTANAETITIRKTKTPIFNSEKTQFKGIWLPAHIGECLEAWEQGK